MKFRITHHSGFAAPAHALEMLWQRLGGFRDDDVRFYRSSTGISATWGEDSRVSMAGDERLEIGRRAVLEVLERVCEGAPELNSDWYAVGPEPR